MKKLLIISVLFTLSACSSTSMNPNDREVTCSDYTSDPSSERKIIQVVTTDGQKINAVDLWSDYHPRNFEIKYAKNCTLNLYRDIAQIERMNSSTHKVTLNNGRNITVGSYQIKDLDYLPARTISPIQPSTFVMAIENDAGDIQALETKVHVFKQLRSLRMTDSVIEPDTMVKVAEAKKQYELDIKLESERKLVKARKQLNEQFDLHVEKKQKEEQDYLHAEIFRDYYESSALKREIPLQNGQPHGVAKEYYESGAIKNEITFQDGQSHGVSKLYYESGALKSETTYQNGRLHGVIKEYYKSGVLEAEHPYQDGQSHGVSKVYYKSGALEGETTYQNGQRHGEIKVYYESGALEGKTTFQDGLQHGVAKEYYESGAIKSETTYQNGQRHGVAEVYSQYGQLLLRVNFVNDREVGRWERK